MRRSIPLLAAGWLALSAVAAMAQPAVPVPAYIAAAVSDPRRSEMVRARDAARKRLNC